MKVNAPTKNIWLVSVVIGVLALIATFVSIPVVSAYAFWFMTAAFVLLALSTVLKGM